MDIEAELSRIFAEDDLGLFDVKPKKSLAKTSDQRLVDSFEKVNDFVAEHGWEPRSDSDLVIEKQLAFCLHGIRNNPEKIAALRDYDRFGLLGEIPAKEYHSLEDVLADRDNDNLLGDDEAESIFNLKHVKAVALPDYISKRKRCKEFDKFEEKFKACQRDLSTGRRQILPFRNANRIEAGQFFILSGVLLYVDKIGVLKLDKNGDLNGRTRCIFENGMESDMRLRSLSSGLYKDGRRVTGLDERMLDGMKDITSDDKETGYIYVLKSKSSDARIQAIADLYKIGYCTEPVEERIANAEQEPTYLMAPVEIVDTFRCFNLNPEKLESLLHNFFGKSCFNRINAFFVGLNSGDAGTSPETLFDKMRRLLTESVFSLSFSPLLN